MSTFLLMTLHDFDDVNEVMEQLRAGGVIGRAVLTP